MRIFTTAVLAALFAILAPEHVHSQEHDHAAGHEHDAHTSTPATDDGSSEREHVAPDPPGNELHDMSYRAMVAMMGMDDRAPVAHVVVDELEWRSGSGPDAASWDAHAWYGSSRGKLWIRTEGTHTAGVTDEADAELLFDRDVARWWSLQAGVRHDFGEGRSRDWLALGVRGLAPYFFELGATAYVGGPGGGALRLEADYDLLFTQRLILRPSLELNLHSSDDPARNIGAGLSDAEVGLRLRYEIRRQFAPYVGVSWTRRFGETANLARRAGEDVTVTQFTAGLRLWF